ncbi:MAG: CopD family protein, partial [Pseudomonadota bacterium]
MISALASADLVTWMSICVKALSYVTTLLAAGSVLVGLGIRAFGPDDRRWLGWLAFAAAIAAAVVSVAQVPVRASFLMGGTLDGALDPMMLSVVAESPLGTSVAVRLAGLALIPAVLLPGRWGPRVAVAGCVVVCASFALRGHALGQPRLLLGVLVTAHLLALAFWIGAFAPLLRAASRAPADTAGRAGQEFGQKAVWAVGMLVAAGAATLLLLGVNDLAAFSTPYGQAVAVKLLLVVGVLALGATNKLLLTPALLQARPSASNNLRRSIQAEAVLIAAILVATAAFTTVSAPPRDEAGRTSETK